MKTKPKKKVQGAKPAFHPGLSIGGSINPERPSPLWYSEQALKLVASNRHLVEDYPTETIVKLVMPIVRGIVNSAFEQRDKENSSYLSK